MVSASLCVVTVLTRYQWKQIGKTPIPKIETSMKVCLSYTEKPLAFEL